MGAVMTWWRQVPSMTLGKWCKISTMSTLVYLDRSEPSNNRFLMDDVNMVNGGVTTAEQAASSIAYW